MPNGFAGNRRLSGCARYKALQEQPGNTTERQNGVTKNLLTSEEGADLADTKEESEMFKNWRTIGCRRPSPPRKNEGPEKRTRGRGGISSCTRKVTLDKAGSWAGLFELSCYPTRRRSPQRGGPFLFFRLIATIKNSCPPSLPVPFRASPVPRRLVSVPRPSSFKPRTGE